MEPDRNGAYINPGELQAIALQPNVTRDVREALERAALEILRQRNYIDVLHIQIDQP